MFIVGDNVGKIHIVLCSVPISAVLEINTASFKRLRYIQVRYRMVALVIFIH